MEVKGIIAEIDAQIQKLQQARQVLSGLSTGESKGPGRPKGSKSTGSGKKRKLSPEGRKRIQEAMKRRWAERRKAAAKGSTSSK